MASALSHAVAGLAIGTAFWRPGVPAPFWVAGAAVATLPDLDSIGFRFGVAYGDMLGHRGLTHSLVFAALLGAGVVAVAFPSGAGSVSRSQLWLYLFLATASHGVLDELTNGGLGVAFFAPSPPFVSASSTPCEAVARKRYSQSWLRETDPAPDGNATATTPAPRSAAKTSECVSPRWPNMSP